jgi:BNR/Asp-box repeat
MPYRFTSAWHAPISGTSHIFTFVFAASAPAIGYACEADYKSNVSSGPPLLVTKDGGASWGSAAAYPMGNAVCQVFSDPGEASDVFIAGPTSGSSTPSLWRSRDGGATWKPLAAITVKQTPASVSTLTVIGSRIVASVVPAGNAGNAFLDDLVVSDDDGATWQRIGESMTTWGQVGRFVTAGSALFVSVAPACVGCQYPDMRLPISGRVPPASSSSSRLSADASSLVASYYFRSTDGGVTWTKIGLPANAALSGATFAPSHAHSGQYVGLVLARSLDVTSGAQVSLLYSVDSGVTWRPVPSIAGAGGGWPDPSTLGQNGQLAVTPSQTIFVGTTHDTTGPQAQGPDSGIFRLGIELSGEWQPVAPDAVLAADGSSTGVVANWQVVPSGSGWRIWGLSYGPAATSGLTYLDAS